MLTEEIKREIEAEFGRFKNKQSACIEAMQIVTRHLGWLSDETIREIAAFLEMTPDEVDGVATFYNHLFRKPVGRHLILVCDSVTCYIMGYEQLIDHLKKSLGVEFGQTTADGRFTLLPIQCLGVCEQAPAVMIDEEVYGDLDPAKLDQILAKYV
ncbi:MAG: NADH-quinone oxidoreductase subunit NuoE [Desulfomonilaceae bacterium]